MIISTDVTVGFDNTEYSTYENENILNVTVELKSGIAFRSFLVHIATSSQQAIEGCLNFDVVTIMYNL